MESIVDGGIVLKNLSYACRIIFEKKMGGGGEGENDNASIERGLKSDSIFERVVKKWNKHKKRMAR